MDAELKKEVSLMFNEQGIKIRNMLNNYLSEFIFNEKIKELNDRISNLEKKINNVEQPKGKK